jgi:hypothetical protein
MICFQQFWCECNFNRCSMALLCTSTALQAGYTQIPVINTFWLGQTRAFTFWTWRSFTMLPSISCTLGGPSGCTSSKMLWCHCQVSFFCSLSWSASLLIVRTNVPGKTPQLYRHDLLSLTSKQSRRFSLTRIPERLVPRKFALTTKVPDTRGCVRCCVGRNPYNGYKYLCGAVPSTGIFLMQWYDPLNKFMLLKVI